MAFIAILCPHCIHCPHINDYACSECNALLKKNVLENVVENAWKKWQFCPHCGKPLGSLNDAIAAGEIEVEKRIPSVKFL